jgi:hypothetical protein
VDLDMPFGDRLEMTTVQRARPAPGSKTPCAAPPPSTQQTIEYRPTALAASHPLPVR